MQARQRELLTELADGAAGQGARTRSTRCSPPHWAEAPDDPARLRVVVDQVALLTDQQAIARHRAVT